MSPRFLAAWFAGGVGTIQHFGRHWPWIRSVMALEGLTIAVGERSERRGSVALVLLVAVVLVAAATGLIIGGRGQAGSYVMSLLAILGVLGVFSILALAAGILRVTGRDSRHAMMSNVLEHAQDGITVIDR